MCKSRKCLTPVPCKQLEVDHTEYLELLKAVEKVKEVKKVFIRSGIRFDYLMYDKNDEFFKKLVRDHVSGQLKVAPEHCSDRVLKLMGKPNIEIYNSFCEKYFKYSKEIGKEQYIVPYLMSSHPGSEMKDALELSEYIKNHHLKPEQVQDFYPTPGTASTCMYYTGIDPFTCKKIYIPNSYDEKTTQRALLQPYKKLKNTSSKKNFKNK